MVFSWNRANVEHIARHSVTPAEAEYVVRHVRTPFPERRPDGKWLIWGKTEMGRLIQVIYIIPSDEEIDPESLRLADRIAWSDGVEQAVYVIHARDLTPEEKTKFRRRIR